MKESVVQKQGTASTRRFYLRKSPRRRNSYSLERGFYIAEFVCGNNPVKYLDPDGREAGYVLDENAVGSFGHAGMYVELDDGAFAFFEVTGIPEGSDVGDSMPGEEGYKSEILSNSSLDSSNLSLADSAGMPLQSGVIRRDFDSKDAMMNYLKGAGNSGGYDSFIEFDTTSAQDKRILNMAMEKGQTFSGYNLIGNSCGVWANDVLTSAGVGIFNVPTLGIESIFLGGIHQKNGPNAIGRNLSSSNGSPFQMIRK